MMLSEFEPRNVLDNPSEFNRILWGKGDIWRTDSDGVPHRMSANYTGGKWSVRVPDSVPMKYRNRKATSMIIWCNACGLVTGVETHYGNPFTTGYAVQLMPETGCTRDVTAHYRKRGN